MAVNLTPNSDGHPDTGEASDGLLQKQRLQYNRDDKDKAEKEQIERVAGPLRERRTREAGATGVTAYAKEPRFEQAVERVQQQLRSGRVSLAQVKAENRADAQRLAGWQAVTPRRGTPGFDRLMSLKTRVAIRATALDREAAMIPTLSPASPPVEMREIGWTDAARAAAVLARRARAIGRKAAKLATRTRPYSPKEIARTMQRLSTINRMRQSGAHRMGMNIHGVAMRA